MTLFSIAIRLLFSIAALGFCARWFARHSNAPPPPGVSRRMDITVGATLTSAVFLILLLAIWSY